MACHAGPREIFVNLANMTGRAIDPFMGAFQLESGFAVVERLYLFPIRLTMATVAFFTKPAFMQVGLFVAVKTTTWCLAESHFLLVTSVALDLFVGALERVVRKGVIKCLPIELNNVGIPPLMVCMTMIAL